MDAPIAELHDLTAAATDTQTRLVRSYGKDDGRPLNLRGGRRQTRITLRRPRILKGLMLIRAATRQAARSENAVLSGR
jgi:hypothetical protein